MPRVRILIVEDELLFRDLLQRALSSEPEIEVVGVTDEGAKAIELARETRPDAVIMDIGLRGEMDGIEAALKIKDERPETGIVILSAHNDKRYVTSLPLSEKPGWSYLLKQTVPSAETVLRAIDTSIEGGLMLDPSVVHRLTPRRNSRLAHLSPRVLETLRLLAQGYNNASIARRMVITVKAVDANISTIYDELGLKEDSDINPRVAAALSFLDETQEMSLDEERAARSEDVRPPTVDDPGSR